MHESVLIKGNKYGLTIILDEEASLDEIQTTLTQKIIDAKRFFKNAKVAITFMGKVLTNKEQQVLISIITDHSDMEVICIMEEHKPKPEPEEDSSDLEPSDLAVFHRGTLRSGQELNMQSSVVIIGDVNPGAKVTAEGNVIVLGNLKGTVVAKECKGKYPFVVALSMDPMQLRIGDIIGRSPDKTQIAGDGKTQIAYVEQDRICIEPLNRNIYNELEYFEQDLKIK